MESLKINDTEIYYETSGAKDGPVIIWAHGWGHNHKAFLPLAGSLKNVGRHIIMDFPGFGKSPAPAKPWGTEDYADIMAAFIKQHTDKSVIWVGHSFGCRVGIQMAARHPEIINSMVLIAAAGLPRRRSPLKRVYFKSRILLFKFLKKLIPLGLNEDWLRTKFGSADYKTAGPMRDVFVKVVNEDLGTVARMASCPVHLIYGTKDTETPIEIGQRLHKLISGSQISELEGLDHYNVLGSGRHQVAPLIKTFIESL